MEEDGSRMGPHLERAQKKKNVKTAGRGGPSCNVNILGDTGKRTAEFKDDLGYTPKAYLKSK